MNSLSQIGLPFRAPTMILVACQPKTASTFLVATLGSLPNSRTVALVPAYGQREQELSEERIKRYRFRAKRLLVAQHHVRYSNYTGDLIRRYHIRTIVLTRNLFDVIASIRDHVRSEDVVSPMFFLTKEMAHSSDEELENLIAKLSIPWYLNFICRGAIFLKHCDWTMRT